MKRFFLLGVVLILGACQTPVFKQQAINRDALDSETRKQELALLRYRLKQIARLRNVAYPVFREGTAMCGEKVVRAPGFSTATPQNFRENERDAAIEAFGLGDLPVVMLVVKNSPASKAGLRKGDVVLSFDGVPVRAGENSRESLNKHYKDFLKTRSDVFDMTVRRSGTEIGLSIRPDILCDYKVHYSVEHAVNASADSKSIYVAAGMMRFVDNEDELATVVGHELAHNTMRHIQKMKTNQAAGMAAGLVLDVLAALAGVNTQGGFTRTVGNIGGQAYSQDFESEADYIGLYFIARAGFDIDAAAPFWRRMGAAKSGVEDLKIATSHPTTSERFLRLEKAADEIRAKMADGRPLMPELEKEAPWLKSDPKDSSGSDEDYKS